MICFIPPATPFWHGGWNLIYKTPNTKFSNHIASHAALLYNVNYDGFSILAQMIKEVFLMKSKSLRWLFAIILSCLICTFLTISYAGTFELPASLITIEPEAFEGDTSIDRVVLPQTITRIESKAFAHSTLKRINLPESLTYIAPDAFDGCNPLVCTGSANTYASRYCKENGITFVPYDEPVTYVQFTKYPTEVYVGDQFILDAYAYPENASLRDISLHYDTEYITASGNGYFTANKSGTVTITATAMDGSNCSTKINIKIYDKLEISAYATTKTIITNETKPSGYAHISGGKPPYTISYTWHADGYELPQQSHMITDIADTSTYWECDTCNNDSGKFHVDIICIDSFKGRAVYTINGFEMKLPTIPVTGITLNKTNINLNVGESATLTATITPDNATNKSVSWKSSNTAVATVDSTGKVTAVTAGSATITVTTADGSKTATCAVTVKVPVSSVTLSKTSATLNVGSTTTLTATVAPSNATNKSISWKSSNTAVATVDSTGKVTAVTAGSATITVTTADGSKTATCAVTVKVPVSSVTLNKTSTTLSAGTSTTLTATVAPSNATNKTVSWKSSNTAVATVDSAGKVTVVAAGSATITVTTADGSKTATCAVTVYSKPTVSSITTPKTSYSVNDVVPYTINISGGKAPYTVKVVEYFKGAKKYEYTLNVSTTEYTYKAGGYTSGGTNYIVVTVTDSLGASSSKQSGNVQIYPIITLGPTATCSVSGTTATFNWPAVTGATSYDIEIYTATNWNLMLQENGAVHRYSIKKTVTGTSYSTTLANGNYVAYVAAGNPVSWAFCKTENATKFTVGEKKLTVTGVTNNGNYEAGKSLNLKFSWSGFDKIIVVFRDYATQKDLEIYEVTGGSWTKGYGPVNGTYEMAVYHAKYDANSKSTNRLDAWKFTVGNIIDIIARLDSQYRPQTPKTYFTDSGSACTHHGAICSYNTESSCNCKCYYNGRWLKSIQCLAYARYVQYKVYGYDEANNPDRFIRIATDCPNANSYSATTLQNWINTAGVGAHIRTNSHNVGYQHSLIVTDITSTGFTIIDANSDGKCGIAQRTYTWQSFVDAYAKRGMEDITYFGN